MSLRLLREADQEVDNAFAAYEAHRVGLGLRFVAALEHGYDQIEAFPNAWPRVQRGARWYLLERFPYAIVYTRTRKELVVIAVSHLSRRRGYWAPRLSKRLK